MKVTLKLKSQSSNKLPAYESVSAAGFDLRAELHNEYIEDIQKDLESHYVVIPRRSRRVIGTGLYMEIPEGFEGQIRSRSGLAAKQGVHVLNSPGTIDGDYRGEIKVILNNASDEEFIVRQGDRIAQMVIAPVVQVEFEYAQTLSFSERGTGGLGSTGIK